MIARVYIALPFNMVVPDDAIFQLYEYDDDGYKVVIHPPIVTDISAGDVPDTITLDELPAHVCTGLQIDFHKPEMNRSEHPAVWEPPIPVLQRAVSNFITRIRFVTGAAHLQVPEVMGLKRRIEFLADDGSELDAADGLVRGKGILGFELTFVAVTPNVWRDAFEMDEDVPVWDTLRLDARRALPDVGVSIVLAFTSLEVFISWALDEAAKAVALRPDLWDWITGRKERLKNPSVEEQYDGLLKVLVGHSLKEESGLWSSFMNLRTARNTFAHGGIATIGGKAVTADEASVLVGNAGECIKIVRGWLPEMHRGPAFTHSIKVQVTKSIPTAMK